MRKVTGDVVPPVLEPSMLPTPTVLADLRLQVVTPMFGGGAVTREVDLDNPIRPSAIRGHLRFWWRACNAGAFDSLDDLRREEARLWGSARKESGPETGPGLIAVAVALDARVRTTRFSDLRTFNYALWPFAEQKREGIPAVDGEIGRAFTLTLTLSDRAGKPIDGLPGEYWPTKTACIDAARQALWAWITFGGVGSRTRRGCGALCCDTCTSDCGIARDDLCMSGKNVPSGAVFANLVRNWIRDRFQANVSGEIGALTSLTMLLDARVSFLSTLEKPMDSWGNALKGLATFVQGENVARNEGKPVYNPQRGRDEKRPGQSYWPEVSAVRTILRWPGTDVPLPKDSHLEHYSIHTAGHERKNQFPRADLGLPRAIRVESNQSAPYGTLEAGLDGHTRMASPIIVKPLVFADGSSVALGARLSAPHIWALDDAPGLHVKDSRVRDPHQATTVLQPAPLNCTENATEWPRLPKRPPHTAGKESARDAFLDYLETDRGWDEVQ